MLTETSPSHGPVALPEGTIPLDDELRALRMALEVAADVVSERPGSAVIRQLHRTAAQQYQEALEEHGLEIQKE
ncbi:MAG: hypothetical protein ABIG34_04940 [Candidatus Peregrinibacteria bacterium]